MPKLETITLIQGTSNQSGADSDAGFQLIISKQGLDVRKEIPRSHRNSKRMKADGHTGKDIANYLGVSRATLYRYVASERAA